MANRYIPLAQRLSDCVIPEPMSGCHLWIGNVNRKGYGRIRVDGKTHVAHRAAWIVAHGQVPSGSMVLHSCDNPACVNPHHLHLGDSFANMREMVERGRCPNRQKTHCRQGHEFNDENTRHENGGAYRVCRACRRIQSRQRAAAARAFLAGGKS